MAASSTLPASKFQPGTATSSEVTSQTGLLLVNLGTPDAPQTAEVRRYLREFLSDPRVLDINPIGRALLLNLIILPTRPKKSAHAYQSIWDANRGSPLLYHSQDLAAAIADELGPAWRVVLAMRYGNPSIMRGLDELRQAGVDRIVVLPLFPQYAASSTGSAVEHVWKLAGQRWNTPWLDVVPPFYDDPGFLEAFAQIGQQHVSEFRADYVLFSFHGLPERHMIKSDDAGNHCLQSASCCDTITVGNRNCYRAQSYYTAREIAQRMSLPKGGWEVAFQSRLGRTPWIKPYTDVSLDAIAKRGVKRLAVMCPAFVADCLETIEEIGMRAKAQFVAAGGEDLRLVPSLNASPRWVTALAEIARKR
ncbi:MAG: ferrochelatase [Kofleriaceae bacterium]|nr:ferrochelatase [Kofleriaceae bacterium]